MILKSSAPAIGNVNVTFTANLMKNGTTALDENTKWVGFLVFQTMLKDKKKKYEKRFIFHESENMSLLKFFTFSKDF